MKKSTFLFIVFFTLTITGHFISIILSKIEHVPQVSLLGTLGGLYLSIWLTVINYCSIKDFKAAAILLYILTAVLLYKYNYDSKGVLLLMYSIFTLNLIIILTYTKVFGLKRERNY